MKKRAVAALVILVIFLGVVTVLAQEWAYVAVVHTDALRDESAIQVEVIEPIEVGRLILIEHRDGNYRQTYKVRHVFEYTVILDEKLDRDFVAGSRIYQ